ncbi:MAG: hypothetical protein QXN05_02630 [Acidilobaceae archaeon]
MSTEVKQYRLILKNTARGPSLQLRVTRPEARETTLIKIGGKGVQELFNIMAEVLRKNNLIEAETKTATMTALRLKPEIGPVVGGYLVMIRRARDPAVWQKLFEDLIVEKLFGAKAILATVLNLSEELSKQKPPSKRVRMLLNPKILDGVSAGIKVLTKKLWGLKKL